MKMKSDNKRALANNTKEVRRMNGCVNTRHQVNNEEGRKSETCLLEISALGFAFAFFVPKPKQKRSKSQKGVGAHPPWTSSPTPWPPRSYLSSSWGKTLANPS